MINLDDKNKIFEIQKGELVNNSVESLAKQLKQSFEESLKVAIPNTYQNIENVVVCGMGGSRFPSFIIKELFKESLVKPYVFNDDYTLPGYVNEKTLVILSSYSGTTEEVILSGEKAKKLGAKILGITAGGPILTMLNEWHMPIYHFNPIYNPSQQPRIGFGYLVGGHLGLLFNLGLIKGNKDEIFEAINFLESLVKQYSINQPEITNPVKQLAQQLYEKYPYYIVSEFLTGVGNAIANQTNETAKQISAFRIIPELNHHLMEGLKNPKSIKNIITFVFFFSHLYSEKIQKRFKITKEVVEKNYLKTIWYKLTGDNKIKQTFELMAIGSYLSMYLSILYNEDPAAIPFVDYFKNKLKE